MATFEEAAEAGVKAAKAIESDVFFYSGPIERVLDLKCIEAVHASHVLGKRDTAILVLTTGGGSPDAAYKIARYFQERYSKFSVLVSGFCKSAGTLIAVGAHELIFMPFGELGPLDIQVGKVDKFDAPQSGLTIQEAFTTLESRAITSFYRIVSEYMNANDGLLSYSLATQAASAFVTQLYAPVMARIDPEEVGARSRSMQIANEYGKRLNIVAQNLKSDTSLTQLAEKYPSHSFVIDQRDAMGLFKNVREANSAEKLLVESLGQFARFPHASRPGMPFLFKALSTPDEKLKVDTRSAPGTRSNDKINGRGRAPADRANPSRTAGTPELSPIGRRAKSSSLVRRGKANGVARQES